MDYQFSRRFEELTEKMLKTLTHNERGQSAMLGRLEGLNVELSCLVRALQEDEGEDAPC
jgi:hypothetical protein